MLLNDKIFLQKLDQQRNKEIFARVIALTNDEYPIETIEGKITAGNISIDGKSSLRRTCSLTMISKDINLTDYQWGLKTKVKVEIGVANEIDENYDKIIWFPQGVFVLNTFNITHNTNSCNIQMSGKDKMCLLNGNLGGALLAETDFGKQEIKTVNETTGEITIEYELLEIKNILQELVHTYANEPYHNIILNDIPETGVELLEYRGDKDIYFFNNQSTNIVDQFTLNERMLCYYSGGPSAGVEIGSLNVKDLDHMNEQSNSTPLTVFLSKDMTGQTYTVSKYGFGSNVGYKPTPLTYAGELIGKVGENITSILDKIVSMLGNFEYFYNIEGQFVFQRKKAYASTIENSLLELNSQQYIVPSFETKAPVYTFTEHNLLSSISFNPTLSTVKNDYSIWGERETASGVKVPIHFRFAIDKKPSQYCYLGRKDGKNSIAPGVYYNNERTDISGISASNKCDWRELIYLMALDYRQYHLDDDFLLKIRDLNVVANVSLFPTGVTGYEQYYTDLEGFWRQIYEPNFNNRLKDDNFYNDRNQPWSKTVIENPGGLTFWIDFLDTEGELNKYSVYAIGSRQLTKNDNKITGVYYKEVPKALFIPAKDFKKYAQKELGYTHFQLTSALENLFIMSSQGKSAKDVLDESLYEHSYCAESINLNVIPIYYLEPNTRIKIQDNLIHIDGEYIIEKITIPLTYNGMMQITATKALSNWL